ncbi:hypothetical protein WICPIJ_005946 [Wickerhamomyces pijperi]|uniref:Uncharacterized protein n=1 Tax=Wickerhamomyces pijperi TaxID=599730 RepID=A0A9P8TKM5_WICPI|nr:hypothetical protein WICPIJ_005946 [Wickerhamomyces pijperi]
MSYYNISDNFPNEILLEVVDFFPTKERFLLIDKVPELGKLYRDLHVVIRRIEEPVPEYVTAYMAKKRAPRSLVAELVLYEGFQSRNYKTYNKVIFQERMAAIFKNINIDNIGRVILEFQFDISSSSVYNPLVFHPFICDCMNGAPHSIEVVKYGVSHRNLTKNRDDSVGVFEHVVGLDASMDNSTDTLVFDAWETIYRLKFKFLNSNFNRGSLFFNELLPSANNAAKHITLSCDLEVSELLNVSVIALDCPDAGASCLTSTSKTDMQKNSLQTSEDLQKAITKYECDNSTNIVTQLLEEYEITDGIPTVCSKIRRFMKHEMHIKRVGTTLDASNLTEDQTDISLYKYIFRCFDNGWKLNPDGKQYTMDVELSRLLEQLSSHATASAPHYHSEPVNVRINLLHSSLGRSPSDNSKLLSLAKLTENIFISCLERIKASENVCYTNKIPYDPVVQDAHWKSFVERFQALAEQNFGNCLNI